MVKDTYIPRDEVVDRNKEFSEVRAQVEKELLKLPGVLAVGVGLKEVRGEAQRQPCFKVTVKKKKAKSEVKKQHRIPETIFGFQTDVVEPMTSVSGANTSKYRPLMAGSQIEPSSSSRQGTLGCFARRDSDSKIVLLTNWHVLVEKQDRLDGERVGQPSHNGCCTCCATNEIAEVVDGHFLTQDMDAAIALLHGQETDSIPEERFLNEIFEIGTIAGTAAPIGTETVFKQGRTSGCTEGQILNDNQGGIQTIYKEYGGLSVTRNQVVVIKPIDPPTDYFVEGDSGSVSINEHNQIVALNYAFTNLHFTMASNIERVASTLGVTVIDSSFHTSSPGQEGVPIRSASVSPVAVSLAEAMAKLEAEIGHFGEGKRLLELFRVHREELLDLVRHRREVMVAWHRYQGPAYLAHIARSVRRENKPLPDEIKGVTLQNLLLKMTAVLQRNGSPELARAIDENYLLVMNVLSSGRSPEEWKAYLASLELVAPT